MKPALLCLIAFTAGISAAWVVPQTAAPAAAIVVPPAVSTAGPPLPPASAPDSARKGRAKEFEDLFPDGDWEPHAQAWADEDPEGFCAWLIEKGERINDSLFNVLFVTWLKKDRDAAFAAYFILPSDVKPDYGFGISSMIYHLLQEPGGFEAAWRWIPQAEDSLQSFALMDGPWLGGRSPKEMAEFLVHRLSGKFISISGMMLDIVAADWARKDIGAVSEWMVTLDPAPRARVFSKIMEVWAASDPAGALDWLEREGNSSEISRAGSPLGQLAKKDPSAALAWWEKNSGSAATGALQGIFFEWVKQDADAARAAALSAQDPAVRALCLREWSGSAGVEAVKSTLSGLVQPADRRVLLETLLHHAKDFDVFAACRDPAFKNDLSPALVRNACSSAAYAMPAAVVFEKAKDLPEHVRVGGITAVLFAWKDFRAASAAVDSLPEGPVKEAAKKVIALRKG